MVTVADHANEHWPIYNRVASNDRLFVHVALNIKIVKRKQRKISATQKGDNAF
jgi:hypothetical protein